MQIHRPRIFDFETREVLQNQVTSHIIDRLLEVTGEKGIYRLGITGGSSVLPIYRMLSQNPQIPWQNAFLFLTDERQVSLDDPKSNYFNITTAFGKDFCKELGEFNFFETNLPPSQAILNYSEKLEVLEGKIFDTNLVSVGPDGHIASLFPGGDYLKHQDQKLLETIAPKKFDISKRFSFTIESMLSSDEILLLIVGENKKHVLNELLEGSFSAKEFPAKFLLAHPNLQIFQSIGSL